MGLPHWLGIAAVVLLIGVIAYGFLRGMKVKDRGDDDGSGDPGFSPPPDHHPP